jgi:hypothetical protein
MNTKEKCQLTRKREGERKKNSEEKKQSAKREWIVDYFWMEAVV